MSEAAALSSHAGRPGLELAPAPSLPEARDPGVAQTQTFPRWHGAAEVGRNHLYRVETELMQREQVNIKGEAVKNHLKPLIMRLAVPGAWEAGEFPWEAGLCQNPSRCRGGAGGE